MCLLITSKGKRVVLKYLERYMNVIKKYIMAGLNCISCELLFNSDIKLPLVLPCGDSICMQCMLRYTYPQPDIYKCSVCWRSYQVTNYFIKELPKNKAILSLINSPVISQQRYGPSPKVLAFSTPEPKRVYDSPDKINRFSTPSTYPYSGSLQLSSPNSVRMKCARDGCNNDRYFLNGEIWEYCCINCKTQASNFSRVN